MIPNHVRAIKLASMLVLSSSLFVALITSVLLSNTSVLLAQTASNAYYVAPDGEDDEAGGYGSEGMPFKTIQYAIDQLKDGPINTVYVRDGIYRERVEVRIDGTASDPIRILGYGQEMPVIDGEYNIPTGEAVTPSGTGNTSIPPAAFVYTPLVKLQGNYIEFRGFEIRNSRGRGIGINHPRKRVHHVSVSNCAVNGVRNAGIHVLNADDITVERCHVTDAANYYPYSRKSSVLNWPVVVNSIGSERVTFRHNHIYESWGEGIAAGRNSKHVLIEENLIHDNFALQVYVHRSHNVTVTRNLVYHSNEGFLRDGQPSQGIVINNEKYFSTSLEIDNVLVSDNIVAGSRRLVSIWSATNSTISNVRIVNNTLVNAHANPSAENSNAAAIFIDEATLQNITIAQNVVSQNEFDVAEILYSPSNGENEVTFSENAWSSSPPIEATDADGDFVGDLKLEYPNAQLASGHVLADWYKPMVSSVLQSTNYGPHEYYDYVFEGSGQRYYVSPEGNDDPNSGTEALPYRTIQYAINQATDPGDMVIVQEGVYPESLLIVDGGEAYNPIRIMADGDSQPVIDGNEYQLPTVGSTTILTIEGSEIQPEPFVYTPLVRIQASHLVFQGFKIAQSRGRGIGISGTAADPTRDVVVRNCTVDGIRNAAIHLLHVEDITVERCQVHDAGNFYPYSRDSGELGWPKAVSVISAKRVNLQQNRIYENWGEGLAAGRNSNSVWVKDNLIYDNFALQLYVLRSQNVVVAQNFLYHTNTNFLRDENPSQCIVINNETFVSDVLPIDYVFVTNNVAVGCRRLVAIWGNSNTEEASNIKIDHNTFVNAYANPDGDPNEATAIWIAETNLANVEVKNNVVLQDGFVLAEVPDDNEVTFAANAWSREPSTIVRDEAGDWVGDPQLVNPNAPLIPGQVEVNWYKPGSTSPLNSMAMGPTAYIVNADTTGTSCWPMADCPPAVPILIGPLGEMEGSLPTFVWGEASGATSYTVVLYSVDSESIVFMETYPQTVCANHQCSVQPATLSLEPGNYIWTAQGHNDYGDSDWATYP